MKLFKVTSNKWQEFDPDDYWRVVLIVADDEKKALELAKKGRKTDKSFGHDISEPIWEFKEEQFPLKIEEITLDAEKMLLTS